MASPCPIRSPTERRQWRSIDVLLLTFGLRAFSSTPKKSVLVVLPQALINRIMQNMSDIARKILIIIENQFLVLNLELA